MFAFPPSLRLSGIGFVIAASLVAGCHRSERLTPDRENATDAFREALEKSVAGSRSLFLPPECIPLLPTDTSLSHPSAGECAAVLSNHSSFHALHRDKRFDRVFLTTSQQCSPLRDYLLESKVWVLCRVMPEGYLFAPAGYPAWQAPSATEAASLVHDPCKRSLWLIGMAGSLIPIGREEDAAKLLDLATCSRTHESYRLATLASLEASLGRWNKSLDYSQQSVRLEPGNRAAMVILVRALLECGRSDEALRRAQELAAAGADAETLFLLARAANAAGDHAGEISALRNLVIIAEQEHQPTGASRLYLGQALAHDGQRGEALRVLEKAGEAPELTDEQKKMIGELRGHLAPK